MQDESDLALVERLLTQHREDLQPGDHPELALPLDTPCGVRKFASLKEKVFISSIAPQLAGVAREVAAILRRENVAAGQRGAGVT